MMLDKLLGINKCSLCQTRLASTKFRAWLLACKELRMLVTLLIDTDDSGKSQLSAKLFPMCDPCWTWCSKNKEAASAILKSKVIYEP